MKKISVLIIVCILLSQLAFTGYAADNNSITIMASEFVDSTPGLDRSEGMVMLYSNQMVGFEVNLTNPADSMKLEFRSAGASRNVLDIRLDSPSGEIIGSIDTNLIAGTEWANYTCDIPFTRPISGKQRIYIKSRGGDHWIVGFTLNIVDPNSITKRFASVEVTDSFKDISNDENRDKINLLADLGLLNKEEDMFRPDQPVTRGDFARIIGTAMNAEIYSTSASPFLDVDINSPDAAIFSGLYMRGVVAGDGQGNFSPNRFLKFNEAVLMCVNALGYKPLTDKLVEAMKLSSKLKIFSGVDTGAEYISRSMASRIIYNLLIADCAVPEKIESDTLIYSKDECGFLEVNSQIYFGEGIVTANYDTGLYNPNLNVKSVLIDDMAYEGGNTNAAGYLGTLCEFFYKEEGGKKKIIAITPVEGVEFETVRTKLDIYFEKITEREIVYSHENKEYDYKLDASTAIIYNGVALDRPLSEVVNPETFTGTITFIDNATGGAWDCVRIDQAYSVLVFGVSLEKVYDKLTGNVIDTNDGIFDLYIKGGRSSVGVLTENDVLTVYKSVNRAGDILTRATTNKKVVEGTITSKENDIFYIDDEPYLVASCCREELYLGLSAKFFVNDYDEIVYVEETSASKVLVGAVLEVELSNDPFDTQTLVKVLTENGIEIFEFTKTVVADGVSVKGTEVYDGKGAFVGLKNITMRTPVAYRLNSANKIRMIDTVQKGIGGIDDVLTQIGEPGNYLPLGSVLVDSSWNRVHPFNAEAKFIKFTSDGLERNYEIATGFINIGDQRVRIVPYALSNDSQIADILLADGYSRSESKVGNPFVFSGVGSCLDEENEEAICIYGYDGRKKVRYVLDMESYEKDETMQKIVSSLKNGDVIWPDIKNSKIKTLMLAYIPGAKTSNDAGIIPVLNESAHIYEGGFDTAILWGEVMEVDSDFIKIKYDNEDNFTWFRIPGVKVATVSEDSDGQLEVINNQDSVCLNIGDTIVAYVSQHNVVEAYVYNGNVAE